MKIEATRAFWLNGEIIPPGRVIEVGQAHGMELIGLRKALGVAEVPASAKRSGAARKTKPDTGEDAEAA